MKQNALIPHLFRSEFSKIVSVLCKHFGIAQVAIAEDIASDTFLSALETWSYKGLPENPTAWLYVTAKNKAVNYLQRNQIFIEKISKNLQHDSASLPANDIDLSEHNINDSQLEMLFAVCHPLLPIESQIALALRILCGFGIDEIAHAFLTNKETINKRLVRAKEKLRSANIQLEFPNQSEISNRLDAVLTCLYLLFNEGYYSETSNTIIREELCVEAMRLTYFLVKNNATDQPNVKALLSLMCFHASRFPARQNSSGEIILYDDQDETLWNQELIAKGAYYLQQASTGDQVSKYHLEASIAYWHTVKKDSPVKWKNILALYDRLLLLAWSPAAALNRLFALSKMEGNLAAINAAENLQLSKNNYYYNLLGQLYTGLDDEKARACFEKAMQLAKSVAEKQSISKRLAMLSII